MASLAITVISSLSGRQFQTSTRPGSTSVRSPKKAAICSPCQRGAAGHSLPRVGEFTHRVGQVLSADGVGSGEFDAGNHQVAAGRHGIPQCRDHSGKVGLSRQEVQDGDEQDGHGPTEIDQAADLGVGENSLQAGLVPRGWPRSARWSAAPAHG